MTNRVYEPPVSVKDPPPLRSLDPSLGIHSREIRGQGLYDLLLPLLLDDCCRGALEQTSEAECGSAVTFVFSQIQHQNK